jgi:hypothetical protein
MRAWPSLSIRILACPLWLAACVLVGLALPGPPAHAGDIAIKDVRATSVNDIIHIDIDLALRFSKEAIEALNSGVPITIEINVEVERKRRFWWNDTLFGAKQRYTITRHALSEQYVIANQVNGDRRAFLDWDDALASLNSLRGLPVMERRLIEPGERYTGAVQVRLDIESLPAPMRPLAYFSPAWRMSSSWFEWKLPA